MGYLNTNLLADDAGAFEGGTTSWTAGSNTTLSVQTTEWLVGTRSMRLTPTAAGSVTATSPRFLVTAGTEYVVRAPLRASTAVAGRVLTATVTWYNATSGGTSLGTKIATINVTNASGWQTANHAVVVGVAPAGALSAAITFSVSGLAAGAFVNTDDLFAGKSNNRTGNLLGFNASSFETDVSEWTADNATLARVSGAIAANSGYYVMGATSVAAGVMDLRTTAAYPVTAGTVYVAYVAIQAVATMDLLFEVRWLDASDVLVSTEQRAYNSAASALTRFAVVGTAPVGATKAKVYVRPTATASGQAIYVDDVSLAVAPNPAGNLLTYDEYSTESTLPAWTINGTCTRAYLSSVITEGYSALQIMGMAAGIVTAQLDRLIPATPGVTYQVGATVVRHNTATGQVINSAVRTRIDWYDADGVLFQADNPDQFYPVDSAADFYTQTNTETRTCPEGAAFGRVGVEMDSTSPNIDLWMIDNVIFMVATPEYDLRTDNETGSITLTVNFVPLSGPLSTTVTIRRMDENGKASPMRGYGVSYNLAPYTPGPLVIEDYEAPLGTRVWYSISWTDAVGTSGGARLLTRVVDTPVLADPDYIWFKSPGIPAMNTKVMMEAPVKWARASRSARYEVVGRKNPVHVTGARAGRTTSLTILIWDASANELFDSLLDSGLPVLVQATPGYGIDGNLYLAVGDADVDPLDPDAREGGWRWTLAVTEIDRPVGGLQGSAVSTWQTILDNPAYATWEDLFNSHETWAEVLTKG